MPGINDEIDVPQDTPSLDDVVRAAWNEHSDSSAESSGSPSPERSTEVPEVAQDTRPRDSSGRFTKVDAPETEAAPEPKLTDADRLSEQPQVQSNALSPPTSWSADAKTHWATLPPALQQAVSKREQEMAEGQRQWSEQRQAVEQALTPLHELSQSNGIPWQEGLNRLLTVEQQLRNPQTAPQMVAQLAQAYGVDLAALVNGTQQPQRAVPAFDPNQFIQQTRQEVAQQVRTELENREIDSTIANFGSATDASGNLLHPHFDAVKQAMGFLITTGKASTMQDAYDKAVWMDPGMRPQVQQSVAPQQIVTKARKAAVSVRGAPANGHVPTNGMNGKSLDEIVRAAYADHAGGTN